MTIQWIITVLPGATNEISAKICKSVQRNHVRAGRTMPRGRKHKISVRLRKRLCTVTAHQPARVCATVKNFLVNSLVSLVALVVTLVLLEVGIRLFYVVPKEKFDDFSLSRSEYYERDAELGWKPRAGIQGEHIRPGIFETRFRTNSRGLRDREYTAEKPPGITRIVALGDSFTWGWGVEDEEIFTEVLERRLPDTEVINLGVTAYGLDQEIKYLLREGLRYDPDIVLQALCLNDILHEEAGPATGGNTNNSPATMPAHEPDTATARSLSAPLSTFAHLKQLLASESHLYRFAIDRVNTNKSLVNLLVSLGLKDSLAGIELLDTNVMPALVKYPLMVERSWEMTRAELAELKRITDEREVRLVIAVIPSVQSVEEKVFMHTIAYTEFDPVDFDLDKPYRLLADYAAELGVEIVVPVERFRERTAQGESLFLPRESHFNAAGQALFAEAILEYLQQHP